MVRERHQQSSAANTNTVRKLFFVTTLMLSCIGLFFVFEASVAESQLLVGQPYHFVAQQLQWFGLGLVLLGILQFVPTSFWQRVAPLLYGFGLLLLFLVFIPGIGVSFNGAKRWIDLGVTVLQPIEFMKFGLVVYFADWMSRTQKLASFLILSGIPIGLVMLQPDLGSCLVLALISFMLYFVAGSKLSHISLLGAAGIVLVLIAIVVSPYRMRRAVTFLNPESDPQGASFHIRQITLALGSGGLFGRGLGNSQQKYAYIPEASSDSIFAIVAEEIGYLGSIGLFLLFMAHLRFAYRIAQSQEPGSFAALLAYGLLLWLAAQLLLNLAAVVALVPLTGVPLPYFSHGGSALVMVLSATGILLRLAKEVPQSS